MADRQMITSYMTKRSKYLMSKFQSCCLVVTAEARPQMERVRMEGRMDGWINAGWQAG